ncbi:unnamed protein product [Auanema sp. JU1783]|nr:unnamed protein product [Auanema sp. JU1783]
MFAPRGRLASCLFLFTVIGVTINWPDGYTNSYPNTSEDSFRTFINDSYIKRGVYLKESTYTILWSVTLNSWFLGYLIGTFLTPICVERSGRKWSLIISSAISLVGAILNLVSILVKIPELFTIGRLVGSVGSGISFTTLILFLQEVSPTHYRGISSFTCETAFLLNTVLGIFCGMDIALGEKLPYLTGLSIIPSIIAIIILIPLKETPKYLLIVEKNIEKATDSILYYHGKTDVQEVLNEIQKEEKEESNEAKSSLLRGCIETFKVPHLRAALILGMVTLELISSFWPITYLSTIFLGDLFSSSVAQYVSLTFIVSNFVGSLLGLLVVERFGRKPLLLIFGSINTFSLILYMICDRMSVSHDGFKYGTIVALIIYGLSYGVGLGPIAYFLTSELVQQQYRSLIQSIVYAFNAILGLIVSTATLPLYNVMGAYCFIPLFIVPSILCLVYLYYYLPETKDREIHDIVQGMMMNAKQRSQITEDNL